MLPVQLDSVSKSYGRSSPVVSMDVTIEAGEFFTLLGPSGCGKSTMLRMIAGFVQPSGGRVLFGDRDVTSVPPHRRDTGMVFQNYALFPHMTVAQNVAYGLKVRKVAKAEATDRIEQALKQVGLAGYSGRRIDQLSGGQQQRVALARAVVIQPSVLLLDEPLSNLDAKLREETRAQIRRVQSEAGITGVYVTHDQAEAMAMSDRIAVLEAGRVHQIAAPQEIYHRPATEFVARFIGGSNVIPVEVADPSDNAVTVVLPGGARLSVPAAPDMDPSTGDSVALALRPENLRFTADDAGLFHGVVREREFNGATNSYVVAVNENLTLRVNGPDSLDAPAVGDRVHLDCVRDRAWLVTK